MTKNATNVFTRILMFNTPSFPHFLMNALNKTSVLSVFEMYGHNIYTSVLLIYGLVEFKLNLKFG